MNAWNLNGEQALSEWNGSPSERWRPRLTEVGRAAQFDLGRAGPNRRLKADLRSRMFAFPDDADQLQVNVTFTHQTPSFERCLFEVQLRDHPRSITWYKNGVLKYNGQRHVEQFSYGIPKQQPDSNLFFINLNFACFNQNGSSENKTATISDFVMTKF